MVRRSSMYIRFTIDSSEVSPFSNVYMTSASAQFWDFTLNRVELDILYAILSGVGLRVIAFFVMILLQRDKQK
jgi:multidrug transporter EmrE-like cation transporter